MADDSYPFVTLDAFVAGTGKPLGEIGGTEMSRGTQACDRTNYPGSASVRILPSAISTARVPYGINWRVWVTIRIVTPVDA